MLENKISFNTIGYDGFIDFIKAYAILCVLLGHTFEPYLDRIGYGVWAGMQVPLFILIQVFHCYKKENVTFKFRKVLNRVMIPFFIMEFFTFLIAYYIGGYDFRTLIRSALCGGYGPGSYFPWVYFQVAILLPLFAYILNSFNKNVSLIIFIVICEGFEVIFSFIGLSESLYRLLAIRYVFLFYLGWLWVKEGIVINRYTIFLTFFSLMSIIYFEYFSVNDEPWFFSTGFKFHRWPCYFFVSYGLTTLLYYLWELLDRNKYIQFVYRFLSSASYEIFLTQMSLFYLIKPNSLISFISSNVLRFCIWMVIVWLLSISVGGWMFIVLNSPKEKRRYYSRMFKE